MIFLFIPKECQHYFCKKTPFEPTCDQKGYTLYECVSCDYVFEADFVAPKGHELANTVVSPLCDEAGYTLHVCSACGMESIDTYVSPKGHNFALTVIEPTCEGQGYVKQQCQDCSFSKNTDYKKPNGHDLSSQIVAPTCTEQGYSIVECANCDHKYVSNYTNPTGHSISKAKTVAPTCSLEGYSVYECSNCSYEYKDNFTSPTGHSVTKTATVANDCLNEGYSTFACSKCDYEYIGERVAPKGHTLAENITEPTCSKAGYTTFSCENCNYVFVSNVVAPLDHDYSKEYVRPNIAQTGYTIYKCVSCGAEHKSDYVFYSDIFSGSAGEGRGSLAFGLDLSYHSGEVDFVALKNSGVEFVILRVGYNTSLDVKFEEYYAAAHEAGLDVGVYFFTLARSKEDAMADAKRVAKWLEGKKLEYPVFYDIEDYNDYQPSTFSEEQIMEITHTFMTEMVNYGYYPGLYTNNNFLYNLFHSEKTLCLYDVWYARYTNATDELVLEYSELYSMWQYKGNVEEYQNGSVEGMCDLNYTFKNYPEIIKKYGFNGYQ